MKKFTFLCLLILVLPASGKTYAGNAELFASVAGEKVELFTDRSIYIAGEQIHFVASVIQTSESKGDESSLMIYCELITPDGNKIVESKYPVSQSSADGCISIPKEQITGVYYLRAYTKAMRNFEPESYSYKQIRIVNPDRDDVLTVNKHVKRTDNLKPDTSNYNSVSQLSITPDKSEYTTREKISFQVNAQSTVSAGLKNLTLFVVPRLSVGQGSNLVLQQKPALTGNSYSAESRGLSITGKLTEVASGMPAKGKRINLSIIGEGRDFMAVRTDSTGRFYFALPWYYGSRDLFLCAEKTAGTDMKIWVDNDFCTLPVNLPAPAFRLTDQEREVVFKMAQNAQISSCFKPDTLVDEALPSVSHKPFYGNPDDILYLDKYVQLPTLDEYFNELPGLVKVRKRQGEKYFKVMGARDLSFYDPLVLVDWVAVDEPARILAVAPQNISRIEIVNELYVKGGQTYGGIISIISKKGDFAGIDLPSTGIFINYRFLTENKCVESVDYSVSGHPDVRNTLLWKTGVSLSSGKSENFTFNAPDTPGTYSIFLEGVNEQGERFSISKDVVVKSR